MTQPSPVKLNIWSPLCRCGRSTAAVLELLACGWPRNNTEYRRHYFSTACSPSAVPCHLATSSEPGLNLAASVRDAAVGCVLYYPKNVQKKVQHFVY